MKQQSSVAKPLVLSQGDPAGVGPAATLLAWQTLRSDRDHVFYVRAFPDYLKREANALQISGLRIEEISHPEEASSVFANALPVLARTDEVSVSAGLPKPETANGIIQSIEDSVADVVRGDAAAIVTNPIAKSLLYAAGFKHPGHTEFLAHLAGVHFNIEPPKPVMMLAGGGLKVALATIHIPLMKVKQALTQELIATIGEIVFSSLARDFGIPSPKLGVCGLNPHAGEDGTLGSEENEIITPAIRQLNAKGFGAIGPRPGDTVFHEALVGKYDAVLAMFHDQGLIPVKTLDIWGGVNVTLGLPFIRTSPDHGTGYDAAASRNIKADSLIAAIRLARSMSNNRQKHATP